MTHEHLVKNLAAGYSTERLLALMRRIAPAFRPMPQPLSHLLKEDEPFEQADKLGVIELEGAVSVLVAEVKVAGDLTERSSKRKQYNLARRFIKDGDHNAAILAFYDAGGRFRLSLITVTYHGTRRRFSTFRRYTFFVDPALPNKTFVQQLGRADFSTMAHIMEAFSLEAVSDAFYQEFKPKYDAIARAVAGTSDEPLKQDFALLFVIRIIFLGFVQKKGWLGDNPRFLQDFWEEYRHSSSPQDTFYREWLEPLFFEALSSPPGRKAAYGHAPFSPKTQLVLQMAPYLNGELFKRKRSVDDQGLYIPDEWIGDFFDFLFQYNFTVEENELYDEELELNPEFLGIIFERITNMDQGAVYTPRVEVDLMCRLALVKWLTPTTNIDKRDLYHLFFREGGTGEAYDEYQKQGDFSPAEIRTLIKRLEHITVCDPAAGSGAFEVGMLQVLDQTLENLYTRNNTPADLKANAPTPFERKKAIIARSLYGVEVKRWAVWINHLRLWLTLFVDMPDEERQSPTPLLPNLTFKVRVGDSLVQRIGGKTFPVQGHAHLPAAVKRKITELRKKKHDYFYNRSHNVHLIAHEELTVFRAILDAQIEERKAALRVLRQPQPKAGVMFEEAAELEARRAADEQKKRDAQAAALETEIANLEAQKRHLKDNRPFIWSIEFAEIFFDRGGFDIIIGNPPYVRQESITDPAGRLSSKEYKEALMEMVRLDFPDYFAPSRARTDRFKKGRKPSGRSDLYTYFYIRSLRLLNPSGVHVFICSNAWLDVGYGAWLQEFFLRKAPLHYVIDNHAKRSFARADVNTVITVASAPRPRGEVPKEHIVRFVAFKQPFEDAVITEHLLDIENAHTIRKTSAYRVFPITVKQLLDEGSDGNKYVGDKWGGKYLRAPDIFFTILEKGKGKLVRLGDIAEVRFGIKTGANDFFYLEPLGPGTQPGLLRVRNGAGWEGEIEEEFLKPIFLSIKETESIRCDVTQFRHLIFRCNKQPSQLEGTKAWEYIQWAERNMSSKSGKPISETPSVRNRKLWYSIEWNYNIDIISNRFVGERFMFVEGGNFETGDVFFVISLKKDFDKQSTIASLNSTLSFLTQEILGRKTYAIGVMYIYGDEIKNHIFLDPRTLFRKNEVNSAIESIKHRKVHPIFTECGIDPRSDVPIAAQEPKPLPDRKALDDIVFDALGLNEEERKEVYRAVCQLVWERISKARSV